MEFNVTKIQDNDLRQLISKKLYRTIASTNAIGNESILLNDFHDNLSRCVRDIKLSEPTRSSGVYLLISVDGNIRLELIKAINPQSGFDKDNSETTEEYTDRTLVDETQTMQRLIEAAFKCGNDVAQHLQDNATTVEEVREQLGKSPDQPLSKRVLLRAKGPNRELDLDHTIVTMGGNLKFPTSIPTKSFDFIGCSVLSRSEDCSFRLSYSSLNADADLKGNIVKIKDPGKVNLEVSPGSFEEKLLDLAMTSNVQVNIQACLMHSISSTDFTLQLTKVLNPEEIATATDITLEKIYTEIKSRGSMSE
jgi:hypothetical protein